MAATRAHVERIQKSEGTEEKKMRRLRLMDKADRDYLDAAFGDLINYSADDPLESVDPLSYMTPEGDSCLHIAAIRGDLRAVRLLLDAGLDPNILGDLGNTPLHYARKSGSALVAQLLLERGALRSLVN